MALLSISPTMKPQSKAAKISTKQTISCEVHRKEVEAYCMDDLTLLCIDCILVDGHKSHDISPIPQAYDKEKDKLRLNVESADKAEEKLCSMLSEVESFRAELNSKANEKKENVDSIFREIARVVCERQELLKHNIESTLKKEEENLCNIASQIKDHLDSISNFKESVARMQSEEVNELLLKSKARKDLAEKANLPLPSPVFTMNFGEVKREAELNVLWKILSPHSGIKSGSNFYTTTASYAKKKTEKFATYAKNQRRSYKKKAEGSPKKDKAVSGVLKGKDAKSSKMITGNLLKLNMPEEVVINKPEILALSVSDSLPINSKKEPRSVKAHKEQESAALPVSARTPPNDNFSTLKQKREMHKNLKGDENLPAELNEESLSDILDHMNPESEILEDSKTLDNLNDLSESLQRLSSISPSQFEVYNNDKFAFESFLANEKQFIYVFCTSQ
eukprot:TRINITY_DN14560_c0_g2_i3.p1 TRINITY_DN14560_c0_g2~~TRINITY_DN14560_c0_g2_i3.p1  ORF type:complete len:449 (+),score=127.56 TRINITY_DN14560_c0_g2_i3:268-1614(+)